MKRKIFSKYTKTKTNYIKNMFNFKFKHKKKEYEMYKTKVQIIFYFNNT